MHSLLHRKERRMQITAVKEDDRKVSRWEAPMKKRRVLIWGQKSDEQEVAKQHWGLLLPHQVPLPPFHLPSAQAWESEQLPRESDGGSRKLGQSQVWVRPGGRGSMREEVKACFYSGLWGITQESMRTWERSAVGGRAFPKATVLHGNEHLDRAKDAGHLLWGRCLRIRNKSWEVNGVDAQTSIS